MGSGKELIPFAGMLRRPFPRNFIGFRDYFNNEFLNMFENDFWRKNYVQETETEFLYEIVMPGLEEGDISAVAEDGFLKVKGGRIEKSEDENIISKTTRSYNFEYPIPSSGLEEKMTASYKAGILYVSIPKPEKEITKTEIPIDYK